MVTNNLFAKKANEMGLKDEQTYAQSEGGDAEMIGAAEGMEGEMSAKAEETPMAITIPISSDPRFETVAEGDTVILTVKGKDDSVVSFDIQDVVAGSQETAGAEAPENLEEI